MARRRSASLQARHHPGCKLEKAWTTFDDATKTKGCTCKPGPLYHVVTRAKVDGKEKQVRTPVGRDRQQAGRELLKVLGELDAHTYQPPQDVTFSEWADQWLAGLESPRPSTKRLYGFTMKAAKRHFGEKIVRHITTSDVVAFLASLGGVTSTTKRRHLRVLGSCLEGAVGHEPPLASYNAVRSLSKQQRPREDTRKAAPFEADELAKLWKVLPEPHLAMAKLAALTGLRQGELIALRWGAIDGDTISVRESYTQGLGFGEAKSRESSREVLLTPKAVDLLAAWRKNGNALPLANALVFPGGGRDGQMVDTTIRRALYDSMEQAGIPREGRDGRRVRDFHSFRHTYASVAIGAGLGLESIAKQLGHSSVSVTERTYAHFLTGARRDLIERANLDAALVV